MKTALFDCAGGASGDMIVASLLDAGLSFTDLRSGLARLGVKGYAIRAAKDSRHGISGTRFDVSVGRGQQPRSLADILRILKRSGLPAIVREHAAAIFHTIGRVEAGIHGMPLAKVHFHEIGAVDSLMDIVGACFGFHRLGIHKVLFTPPSLGSGWVETEHGKIPVPAPATVALLKNIPARWGLPGPGEWTTPTAAAILTHFGHCVETLLSFTCNTVAYGVGHKDPTSHANVLRLVVGDGPAAGEHVWSVQTNLDDMQPQWFGPVMEKLFAAGALDVFFIPIQMKKNRPGTIIEVLSDDTCLDAITNILFSDTTTFGLRMQRVQRRTLEREIRKLKTPFGPIRFKIGSLGGKRIKSVPEFEDCMAASRKHRIPLSDIYKRLAKIL